MPVINNVQNQRNTPALYSDVLANRPAAGFAGRLFVSEDTLALYRDTGSGWTLIGGPGTGTITGSGTAGKITKFSGAAVIGDSIITESGAALTVAGTITATSLITSGGTALQYVTGAGTLVTFPTNVSAFTNDAGYITASSSSNLTNKTGNISQWTNNAGYITASSSSNLTNKTGNISQWTNDSGYITSAGAVTSITGTTNQVITSAATGAITLSLPQSIATSSTPTFNGATFTGVVDAGVNTIMGGSGVFLGNVSINNNATAFNWINANNKVSITATSGVLSIYTGTTTYDLAFVVSAAGHLDMQGHNITAGSLIKQGGTSAQFLKADGSVDSSVYVTASSTTVFTNKSGNVSQWSNDSGYITSAALTGYLPLAGGTLTGQLNGTGISLSGSLVTAMDVYIANGNSLYFRNGANNAYLSVISLNSSDKVIIDASGNGTAIGGGGVVTIGLTAGTPTGTILAQTASFKTMAVPSAVNGGQTQWSYGPNAASRGWIAVSDCYGNGDFGFLQSTTQTGTTYVNKLIIGAAGDLTIGSVPGTGTGAVYASGFIKAGGTSAQFLKADGSVDSNTYLTSAGAVTSITGTANQVIASASTGAVTLSLPQSIATSSTPTFAGLTLSGNCNMNTGATSFQWTNASNNVAISAASGILTLYTGTGGYTSAMVINASQIISTASRVNINGAVDNALFTLNVQGHTYTNSFSGTAQTVSANFTIGSSMCYYFNGAGGVTGTMENPSGTNKIFFVKNWSANTLTIAAYASGGTIIDSINSSVSSFSLLTGQTAILQQDGNFRTFILNIY